MTILCFAEDPGSANGIISLSRHEDVVVQAGGAAATYMQDHGVTLVENEPDSISAFMIGVGHTADSRGFDLIQRARAMNIPSFGFVDACVNADRRFKGHTHNSLHHAPDAVFVTEQSTAQAFKDLGFPADHVHDVGNPRYDYVVRRIADQPAPDGSAPLVLLCADPVDPRIGGPYAQSGFGAKSADDVRSGLVLDALDGLVAPDDILVKLHPRNKPSDFSGYPVYKGHGLGIDLAAQAQIVIGTTTSLLVESALVGVPTIAVLLTPQERGWLPQILPDTLQLVTTQEDMARAVKQALDNPYQKTVPKNLDVLCRNASDAMIRIIRAYS